MKSIRNIAATLVLLAALPLLSPAQSPGTERSLICTTSDGILLITADNVRIRDYRFTLVSVANNGVLRLADRRNGATAELDMRSDEGLYIVVRDAAATMQLVAPRSKMFIRGSASDASQPVSADASENLITLAQHTPLYSSAH